METPARISDSWRRGGSLPLSWPSHPGGGGAGLGWGLGDSAMACSPTSSEEEMALSLSECSGAEDSESSREGSRGPGSLTVVSSSGEISGDTDSSLVICVVVPDLQQSIVLNFDSSATIWSAKQQVLCTLTQPLRDVLNYGLFQPAFQGRESGFLDEEQPLRQFSIPKCQGVPTLEFRYKSRVYKHTNVNEMLIAKINIQTLLDLGSSVNYKDSQSLTPLYHSVLVGGELACCLLLLRYHATLGCSDENGWTEIHQACRYGHLQHLEQLLLFGADISSQNATGNTGLHISALHKQHQEDQDEEFSLHFNVWKNPPLAQHAAATFPSSLFRVQHLSYCSWVRRTSPEPQTPGHPE
ncbi:hypothetical protein CRUP_008238 [Coryphaenoides rupestris]|nr:hypothetical protein CRUP_008238 [Coryphaenoides rupestris]